MLKLYSKYGSVAEVEPFVDELVTKFNLGPERKSDILVSLTEAVTNAIIHGNCEQETKTVKVKSKRDKDCLTLQVTDEGGGFDYQNLPDPTAPENLCRCGGRGVFIMKQLSDNLIFHNNGRTVEMRFKL
jgi:serine/threonine-protein kinase RsbW